MPAPRLSLLSPDEIRAIHAASLEILCHVGVQVHNNTLLAGADLFGHAGIVGADHGGSLAWLLADNEALGFAKRIARGFDVDEENLAVPVVSAVGPGGNYLAEMHTRQHFRRELWLPGSMWTRETYDTWSASGGLSMEQRLSPSVDHLLKSHVPEPLDPALEQEIDRLVAASRRELVD